MKKLFAKSALYVFSVATCIFTNIAGAEHITINAANGYPYQNLMNRADEVKVFYITNGGSFTCNVQVTKGKRVWNSIEIKAEKVSFDKEPLVNCLSVEDAEQLLIQTYVQFGIGL